MMRLKETLRPVCTQKDTRKGIILLEGVSIIQLLFRGTGSVNLSKRKRSKPVIGEALEIAVLAAMRSPYQLSENRTLL